MYIKTADIFRAVTLTVLAVLGAWIVLRFLLPCIAPFIAAFVLARLMEPAVRYLCRRGWSREFASGSCTLMLFALLAAVLWSLLARAMAELAVLSEHLPGAIAYAVRSFSGLRQRFGGYVSAMPPELVSWLDSAIDEGMRSFASLPAKLSEKLIVFVSAAASRTPDILLFVITGAMGVYFISEAYPGMQAYLDTHLPDVWQRRRLVFGSNMRFTVGKYLKAQLILMVITFFELLAALLLLRVDGALLMSFLTAVLDALPVLGAGAVLIPWGAAAFLSGNAPLGLGLILTWGIISILRNCIQAKLLGSQMGLHPLVTLMALYVGWYIAGIWGMVLFPMAALMLKQFAGSGVMNAWERRYGE